MFQINNMTQMSCNFREQSKIVRTGGIPLWGKPNQTSPLTSPPTQASALASVFGGFATWGKPEPARITSETEAPRTGAKIRGEGGVMCGLIYLINGLKETSPIQNEGSQ